MTRNYKPDGYNSISPYFIVEDISRFVKLIIAIFDGQELRKYETSEGQIMHVELKIDDSVIMASPATEHYPANQKMIHVYVPDAKLTFQKAIDLGCESIKIPSIEKNDSDLRGMFKDFAGNIWAVGTQVT